MKKFNQLVIANQNDITEGEKAFLDVHNAIMRDGNIMAEFYVSLAANLKVMRDDKLYTAAGFENFEDYAENAVGLKRSQAYSYIKVIETYGDNFVHTCGQKIGISKLKLLASLSTEEREVVDAKVNVEDVSVRELEKQIKELKAKKTEAERSLQEKDTAMSEMEQYTVGLERQIEELQSTTKGESDDAELKAEIEKLKGEIKNLKAKPAEKEVVEVKDEKTTAELKDAKKQLAERDAAVKQKEQELIQLQKRLEIAGDEKLVRFKVKFEELKTSIKDVLTEVSELNPDKQENCKQALKQLFAKASEMAI